MPRAHPNHRIGHHARRWEKIQRTARTQQIQELRLQDALSTAPPPAGLEQVETNREPDQAVALNPRTVIALFGEQLLAALSARPE